MGSRKKDEMNFERTKDIVLMSLASIVSMYVGSQMNEIAKSIAELNVRIAVLVERAEMDRKRLDTHEARLQTLETVRVKK